MSGTSTYKPGEDPTASASGLSNMFLGNKPLAQTYTPAAMPTAPSASFAELSKAGSLPGLTGSLIGNSSMPALPQAFAPMPYVEPAAPAPVASSARPNVHGLYYSGSNVNRSGMTSYGGQPGAVTGGKPAMTDGKPTPGVKIFRANPYAR